MRDLSSLGNKNNDCLNRKQGKESMMAPRVLAGAEESTELGRGHTYAGFE